jgi:hypothetical protein
VIGTTLDTTEPRTVRERIARAFESIDDAFCAFDHGMRLTFAADRLDLPSGPPLGLGGARTGTTVSLPCAWTLFFYTDGLIEARSGPRPNADRFGEDGLLDYLAAHPSPANLDGTGLDALLGHVLQLSGDGFADDVAVLLVRHHPEAAGPGPRTPRPQR